MSVEYVSKEQWCEHFPEPLSDPLQSSPGEYFVYYVLRKNGRNAYTDMSETYDQGSVLYCNLKGLVEQEYHFQYPFQKIRISLITHDYLSAVFRSPFNGEVIRDAVYEVCKYYKLDSNWREIRDNLKTRIKNLEANWMGNSPLPRGDTRVWMEAQYDKQKGHSWSEKERTYFNPLYYGDFVKYMRNDDGELTYQRMYVTNRKRRKDFLLPDNLGLAGQIIF